MLKALASILILSSICFGSGATFAALARTGDFALIDAQGRFHQLSRYQHRDALVLMSYSSACQAMPKLMAQYVAIQEQFNGQSVQFLLIDSANASRESLAKQALSIPLLQDEEKLVSEALGFTHVGDVRVINPSRLAIYYAGGLSDDVSSTLDTVLTARLRNTVQHASVSDCEIEYLQREQAPDYVADVAPIIIDNCVECHRQWGAGPFAMDSHISLLGWSPMIKEVLLNKRMPPAQIDPAIGHSLNASNLDPIDVQTIVHWINAGGPRGESEIDPLEQLEFAEEQPWLLGEPDLVVTTPTHSVPANGVIDDLYEEVILPFEQDRWLKAVQFKPTGNGTLHQLIVMVTPADQDFWGQEKTFSNVSRRFIESYLPGEQAVAIFEADSAVFIPKGHKLAMQFQYVGMGADVENVTELALYFEDNGDTLTERLVQAVSAPAFTLPANEEEIPMEASHRFDRDVIITGVRARMNERGKRMSFALERPDGSVQALLSIPAYNYAWQPHYLLEEPVLAPAGSTVYVYGAFDNSVSNPFNPDPTKTVESGVDAESEMFTGYFTYYHAH
ncbi:MAG: redoxin domain-containing protein [Pseudohongiellaceae bacterium]|nr:redoxin domain-containing protein [Pseudohongiellaceae bacterium]